MTDTQGPVRRQPLNSLATKIIFVVFLSTFLTALLVSWISVHSTYTFLRKRLDRDFPAVLEASAERTRSWLREGTHDLAALADEPALAAALAGEGGREARGALRAHLERHQELEAVVLTDPRGRVRAHAGLPAERARALAGRAGRRAEPRLWVLPLDEGVRRPVASVPVPGADAGAPGTVHGLFRTDALASRLRSEALGPGVTLRLLDAEGRLQAPGPRAGTRLPGVDEVIAEGPTGRVREWQNAEGRTLVGGLLPLGALDWYVGVAQPFELAFEPVFAVVTRVFVIDLCIVLLFSFLAYQITAAIVRPIEALSEGARRISQGQLEVEIPDAQGRDELGLLTRTFNDMTRTLRDDQSQIHDANEKLRAQNEELQRANEVLSQLSITDGLTKLHNHRFFQDYLTREIKRVSRTAEPLAILLMDIDDFKRLNDRLGHAAGDELLKRIALILNDAIRETDLVARYGGEEFVVLATNTDRPGALHLAEKVRTAVAESSFLLDESMQLTKVTLSVGVAQYRGNRKAFFRAADQALYRAKEAGKNCVMAESDAELAEPPRPEPLRSLPDA